MPSTISQPVAASLTRAAMFLVVTMNDGAEHEATVRGLVRRSGGSPARGRLPRPRRPAVLRHGVRLRRLGPAVRRAEAEGTPSVPRNPRPASRRRDAGRHPLPYPRHAHGPVLRAGGPDHGAAGRRRRHGRRSARLQVLRRSRPARVRRRHGEPRRPGGRRRHRHRRGGRGVRRRQLRDRAEVPARPRGMERRARRAAGRLCRPDQAQRHRARRCRRSRALPTTP